MAGMLAALLDHRVGAAVQARRNSGVTRRFKVLVAAGVAASFASTVQAAPNGEIELYEEPSSVLIEIEPMADEPPPPQAGTGALVFLNRMGGVFTPGQPNNSRTNVSSVPDKAVSVPPWQVSDADWAEVTECVDELLSPFNLELTEENPTQRDHIEAVVGGSPGSMGLKGSVAGVSPFQDRLLGHRQLGGVHLPGRARQRQASSVRDHRSGDCALVRTRPRVPVPGPNDLSDRLRAQGVPVHRVHLWRATGS